MESEAESEEKHGVWDPMPELTITSPYRSTPDRLQHIYHGQPYARVDCLPQSGTLDLASGISGQQKLSLGKKDPGGLLIGRWIKTEFSFSNALL